MRKMLLLLWLVVAPVWGAVRGPVALQEAQLPPARAHCRVFVSAGAQTRLLVLQNAYEQDALSVFDYRETLPNLLVMGDGAEQEKQEADRMYVQLKPALKRAAQWLQPRVDSRQCFAHFVAALPELAEDDATARINRRLDQLRDRARRDGGFPFTLTEHSTQHRDVESVAASGELQLVSPAWRRYFQVVGTNYFAGRVAPSLSPGQIEVFGLLHAEESGLDSEMVFDVRERWRRSKRQRQVSVALNTSDFYGRGYRGFGPKGVLQAALQLQLEQTPEAAKADTLEHPCFLRDYSAVMEGHNGTVIGAGDGDKCLSLIRKHAAASNANCPPENFCVLGGAPQPRPFGSFYASGVLREAVLAASRVLDHVGQKQEEDAVAQLLLPTPSLTVLREAVSTICALSHAELVQSSKTESSSFSLGSQQQANLCFDLCYTIVLLEQVGVEDVDERVHFVEHFEKQPLVSRQGSGTSEGQGTPTELLEWLTGAFLYLEALQRKVTFSIESELLAEQLSAGLPLGWNMSLLVFVAACCFLYLTTGRGVMPSRAGRGANGYHRVVNGNAKAKYKDSTQSIMFIDDARE